MLVIEVKNLQAQVGEKEILKGVDFFFETGKNYCILGKNGSGKSSLANTIAGNPKYEVIGGSIGVDKKDVINMTPDERSKAGIFLAFQNVPEIPGIRLIEYLRSIYNVHLKNINPDIKELSPFIFKRFVKKYLLELDIDEKFLERDLNVGFSGGEKRKIEILQMKLIEPKYIILDEIDSGLDLDAFRTIATMLQNMSSPNTTFIIITHYFKILEYVDVSMVYVMESGKVVRQGGKELAEEVSEKGFG